MKRLFIPMLMSLTFLLATGVMANNKIANGINNFGFELNKVLIKGDGNLAYSPLSISSALSTTYAGAKGATAKAMRTQMHFGKNNPKFHQAYGRALITLQTQSSEGPALKIANSMWLQQEYDIEKAFEEMIKWAYGITPDKLNFKESPADAVIAINKKVSEQTNNEIPALLNKLDNSTRFVITNAVFFEGQWAMQFGEHLHEDTFTLASKEEIQANYMRQENCFNMGQDDNKKFVLMPYRNSHLAALVVVPNDGTTIYDLDASLNAEAIFSMMGMMETKKLDLALPKFKIETSVPSMKNVLTTLGLGIMFDPALVDLSGINGVTEGDGKLVISDVVHKAVVDVTPFGTKAAAATALIGVRTTSIMPDDQPIPFNVNGPFYFFIVDTTNNLMLFNVRVMNPNL